MRTSCPWKTKAAFERKRYDWSTDRIGDRDGVEAWRGHQPRRGPGVYCSGSEREAAASLRRRQVGGRRRQAAPQVRGNQVGGKQVGGKQVGGKQVSGKQVGGKRVGGKRVSGKRSCRGSARQPHAVGFLGDVFGSRYRTERFCPWKAFHVRKRSVR